MGQLQLLLSLLLVEFSCWQLSHCTLTVTVPNVRIELEKTGEDLGPEFTVNRRYSISISCHSTSTEAMDEPKVTWFRADSPKPLGGNRYTISDSLSKNKKNYTSVLAVKFPSVDDVNEYTCSVRASKGNAAVNATGSFESRPLISFRNSVSGKSYKNSDISIWPEESISITCNATNFPKSLVKWMKAGKLLSSNATLMLNSVSYESDRGTFVCTASNKLGNNTAVLFLRVKNPQAFLVPLIVLIVQIAIIAAIVGAYEFRRHQQKKQRELEVKAE